MKIVEKALCADKLSFMKRRSVLKVLAAALPLAAFGGYKGRKPEKTQKYRAVSRDLFYESASPDDVFPKVFEVGKISEVRIRARGLPDTAWISCASENGFDLDGNNYFPEYATIFSDGSVSGYKKQSPADRLKTPHLPYERTSEGIVLKVVFPREGRYVFSMRSGGKVIGRVWVYALESDLFSLRPYRGDIHMHTTFSDGRDTNLEMALSALSVGCDFISPSDHRRREGSIDLIRKFEGVPSSLKVFPAEESHASLLHINNFGSTGSIEEWSRRERADFDARTNRILGSIPPSLKLSDLDALTLAQSEAVFEKIGEMGGISIFNHPYWRRNGEQLCVSDGLRDALISRGKFDAYEIVNGSINYDSSDLSAARHAEAAQSGNYMPIVGCSDAHNSGELGCGVTLAFAASCDLNGVKSAIMSRSTVAVDTFGSFERPKMYGKMRMLKYASFLWKNFFPLHDEICLGQAAALREYFEGGKTRELRERVAEEAGKLADLEKKVWG